MLKGEESGKCVPGERKLHRVFYWLDRKEKTNVSADMSQRFHPIQLLNTIETLGQ